MNLQNIILIELADGTFSAAHSDHPEVASGCGVRKEQALYNLGCNLVEAAVWEYAEEF